MSAQVLAVNTKYTFHFVPHFQCCCTKVEATKLRELAITTNMTTLTRRCSIPGTCSRIRTERVASMLQPEGSGFTSL
jgi:hypothetical protein